MKILQNLIPYNRDDPLFDGTLTKARATNVNITLDESVNIEGHVIALNDNRYSIYSLRSSITTNQSFFYPFAKVSFVSFVQDQFVGVNLGSFTNSNIVEFQAGLVHDLPGGEVSSTSKHTTAQSVRTASGIVYEDVAGYEYETWDVQVPYISIETYNRFKLVNLSRPMFIKFEGEFGREDTVFATISTSDITVQTIGLKAGYSLQISLQEAK